MALALTIQGLEVRLHGSGAHRATTLGSLRLILGPPLAGQVLGGQCPGCIQYSYKQVTMDSRALSAEERPAFRLWSSVMTPSSESLGQMWVDSDSIFMGFSALKPQAQNQSPHLLDKDMRQHMWVLQ